MLDLSHIYLWCWKCCTPVKGSKGVLPFEAKKNASLVGAFFFCDDPGRSQAFLVGYKVS
jgi:hypothetical protein